MPKAKEHNQSQAERFKEAARELGCDEDETRFEEALKRVARHKLIPKVPRAQKKSKTGKATK